MECECGKILVKVPNKKKLYWCKKCGRLWRLASEDPITGNCVLVDYEAELEEQEIITKIKQ